MKQDAFKFCQAVKKALLSTNNVKYTEFKRTLTMFKNKMLTEEALIATLTELFKDYEDLHLEFQKFIPKQEKSQPPTDEGEVTVVLVSAYSSSGEKEHSQDQQQFDQEKCKEFLNRVEDRFANDIKVYNGLLDVLGSYADHKITAMTSLYTKVCRLFQGHIDLVQHFETFLDGKDRLNLISALRSFAKADRLNELDKSLERYKDVIKTLMKQESPDPAWKVMEEEKLECMAELYCSEYENADRVKRGNFKWEMLDEMKRDEKRVLKVVIPLLEGKKKDIEQELAVVKAFFQELIALPVPRS